MAEQYGDFYQKDPLIIEKPQSYLNKIKHYTSGNYAVITTCL